MTKPTLTLTIRDAVGRCLESKVGTRGELDAFLDKSGYPFTVNDIRLGGNPVTDEDGQVYYIAE